MIPTTHNVKGFNATYELTYDVIGIIHQQAHKLANLDQD
jgi:hypothetical protein